MKLILTSCMDLYYKDEDGKRIAQNFGNKNGILDLIKKLTPKQENSVFVASDEFNFDVTDIYANATFDSFKITYPFKNYFILDGRTEEKTKEFIEKQTISWLHDFYKWLSETKHRTDIITEKPIFLDQKGRAVAAFDEDNQLILFLPVKNVDGYTVVNDELLKNEETKKYIESIGVKQPSLKDQIYNIIWFVSDGNCYCSSI